MSEDTQQETLVVVGFLGLVAALVFGTLKCEAQRQSCVTVSGR
jgi:hypothetical protein